MPSGFGTQVLFSAVELGVPYDKPQDKGSLPLQLIQGLLISREPALPQCCSPLLIVVLQGCPWSCETGLHKRDILIKPAHHIHCGRKGPMQVSVPSPGPQQHIVLWAGQAALMPSRLCARGHQESSSSLTMR